MTDIGPEGTKELLAQAPQAIVKPEFVDDPHAPEYFSSFLCGAAFDNPNVRLTFASSRVNHATDSAVPKTVVNLRVVMSIPAAHQMMQFLTQFLQKANLNAIQKPANEQMQ